MPYIALVHAQTMPLPRFDHPGSPCSAYITIQVISLNAEVNLTPSCGTAPAYCLTSQPSNGFRRPASFTHFQSLPPPPVLPHFLPVVFINLSQSIFHPSLNPPPFFSPISNFPYCIRSISAPGFDLFLNSGLHRPIPYPSFQHHHTFLLSLLVFTFPLFHSSHIKP